MTPFQKRMMPLLAFILTGLVSLVFYVFQDKAMDKRMLLFPDIRTGSAVPEYRHVSRSEPETASIKRLLTLILAGPQDITLGYLFPSQTVVKAVHLYGNTIVISLGGNVQDSGERVVLAPRERLRWLERILRQNYPFLGKVVFLVNGAEALMN